jgi:trimeric autotransporter adhesin
MPSTINASNSGSGGLISTGDASGVLQLQTASTAALTIDASQNVGIGTTSPASKLDINTGASTGTTDMITLGGLDNASTKQTYGVIQMGIENNTASSEQGNILLQTVESGTVRTRININGSGYQAFSNGGTERMRIDSSGNLLVGTTSTYTNTAKFNAVQSTASNTAAAIATNYSSDAGQAALYIGKFDNTSTTGQLFVRFLINNTGSGSGQINANGASAAAFGSYSDSRLKENITNLPSQLANIMALRPVEFDYIQSEGGGHQIGFIAQEVNEIYPDLVGERADGMFTLTDLNKNDARLIKAIQEMKAIIDTQAELISGQAATINALVTRIEALENK